MAVDLSQQETERGGDHERSLAEVWQELFHQVWKDVHIMVYEMGACVPKDKDFMLAVLNTF